MIPIEHQELASAAASITFSDIPQDYTDLYLVFSIRTERSPNTEDSVLIRFNGTTTGYSIRALYAAGTVSTISESTTGISRVFGATNAQTANTFSNSQVYIPNYTSSAYKSVSGDSVNETNGAEGWKSIVAGLWSNTAAITSITLVPNVGPNFMQYSSATLYGILAGSDGITSVS